MSQPETDADRWELLRQRIEDVIPPLDALLEQLLELRAKIEDEDHAD